MSFQFSFADSDDLDLEVEPHTQTQQNHPQTSAVIDTTQDPLARELALQDLLDSLPPSLSYSPISIPLDPLHPQQDRNTLHLARRDLFDARFQILHDAHPPEDLEEGENNNLNLKDDPATQAAAVGADSDLLPGLYEGGLKTWECAADLIAELDSRRSSGGLEFRGKKIIELGCGTALPSMYILSQLVSQTSSSSESKGPTEIHLTDFNPQVLRLVTLPNLILTWFFSSPAALPFHTTTQDPDPFSTTQQQQQGTKRPPHTPAELELTPDLLSTFQSDLLKSHNIHLRFFSGPWSTLNQVLSPQPYDLVFTSETVYSLSTLPSLVHILHACSSSTALCLVAAKILYFGVGGGVHSFINALAPTGGHAHVVREINVGVGRAVLETSWSS
ncbi:hypothetical protein CF327_g6306 [Tilletia walkeri]|uniref:protein-histidine N-methyltransferase n=1 Tax=Tilletia walkeri TaxID=117179 RepID=A0A8X7T7M0_9BASI|nr:hypothetical protein CF327_g6306 [Tilletia walkeri]KAE8271947.1 hypothetical protein A4X09_0g420 [Tilletia walkeri]